MHKLNKDLIRRNIFKLLDYSGLPDVKFSNLLQISERNFKRIKKEEAEFSIDNINKACDFFKKSIAEINKKEVELDRMFRDKLITKHKGNAEYSKVLEDRPSITFAIKFELLENLDFKSKALMTSEIRDIFLSRGWDFDGDYIALAMARNKDKINSKPHPTKGGTNVYFPK